MIAESWHRADVRLVRRVQISGAPPVPLPHHPKRSMRPHMIEVTWVAYGSDTGGWRLDGITVHGLAGGPRDIPSAASAWFLRTSDDGFPAWAIELVEATRPTLPTG